MKTCRLQTKTINSLRISSRLFCSAWTHKLNCKAKARTQATCTSKSFLRDVKTIMMLQLLKTALRVILATSLSCGPFRASLTYRIKKSPSSLISSSISYNHLLSSKSYFNRTRHSCETLKLAFSSLSQSPFISCLPMRLRKKLTQIMPCHSLFC